MKLIETFLKSVVIKHYFLMEKKKLYQLKFLNNLLDDVYYRYNSLVTFIPRKQIMWSRDHFLALRLPAMAEFTFSQQNSLVPFQSLGVLGLLVVIHSVINSRNTLDITKENSD